MVGTSQEDTTGQASDDDAAEKRGESAEDGGRSGQEDGGDSPADGDEEQQQKGESEKSEGDAASEDSKPYDVNDKDSIARMVSKYASQLKDMQEKFDALMKELERVRPHVQQTS